jgi:hypothetical protein
MQQIGKRMPTIVVPVIHFESTDALSPERFIEQLQTQRAKRLVVIPAEDGSCVLFAFKEYTKMGDVWAAGTITPTEDLRIRVTGVIGYGYDILFSSVILLLGAVWILVGLVRSSAPMMGYLLLAFIWGLVFLAGYVVAFLYVSDKLRRILKIF